MKVLFIGGGFAFWGMEQSMLTLEAGLQKYDVKCVNVVSGWGDGVFAAKLTESGVENYAIKLGRLYLTRPEWTFGTLKELPRAARQLRGLVRRFEPDVIVHMDNRFFMVTYPILFGFRCKHVYSESVTPSRKWIDLLTYRFIFATCSTIIVNSIDTAESFKRINPGKSPIVTIECGVDCDGLKSTRHPVNDFVTIGIVGQIVERKGHDILIESLARLKSRNHRARVVIIGKATQEFAGILRAKISELDLETDVRWIDVIREKTEIYNKFDILAVPSRSEAFGLVAAEAGAAGLPVVASRVGGLQHVVADGESGFLVDPENVDQLADALQRLIGDPSLRRAMGGAGRRRVATRFGTDRMAANFVEAVRTCE